MDAFEKVIEQVLRRHGYWTTTSYKVELTKEDKVAIGKPSSPRWEIDVVAFKAAKNEVLAIECKSFLNSRGVVFIHGRFEPEDRYKLFSDAKVRDVVLNRLAVQLVERGACETRPEPVLCLATGKIAGGSNLEAMRRLFESNGWRLLDADWVRAELEGAAASGYENEVAFVVTKVLLRNGDLEP